MTSVRLARHVAPALMALSCACGTAIAANGTSQDSVGYQINASHTGNINFSGGFSAPLKQLWSVNLGGGISYPVTADGKAFVTVGMNGSTLLEALNLATGAVEWEKLLAGSGSWADPAYDKGAVFVINSSGQLAAFNASTGRLRWSVQVPGEQNNYYLEYGAPAAHNGLVVVQYQGQNGSESIGAYDERTGANLWTVSPQGGVATGIAGVPALDSAGNVFVGNDTDFFDFSTTDGSTTWSEPSSCYPTDAPVLAGVSVYETRNYENNCSNNLIYDAATGSPTGAFAGSYAPVILNKNYVVVVLGGTLYAYSPKNDNVSWTFTGSSNNYFYEKPVVINGYVAALSQDGQLYLLDGSTGQEYWTTSLNNNYNYGGGPDTGLGAGEGTLLVPDNGTLYAFVPQNSRHR